MKQACLTVQPEFTAVLIQDPITNASCSRSNQTGGGWSEGEKLFLSVRQNHGIVRKRCCLFVLLATENIALKLKSEYSC